MSLLLALIYLAMVGLTGYAALSAVLGSARRHWATIAGLSFAGGVGIWGTILFLASLAGFTPNRTVLILISFATVALLVFLRFRERLLLPSKPASLRKKWDARSILGGFAAVVIVLTAVNVAVEALTPGLYDIDSYAIWLLKAKIAASQPLRPVPDFLRDPSLSFSHQDYPLGFPLIVAGAYAATGGIDVQLGKLVLLPIYLSLVAVIYAALRGMVRRADALAITAVFAAAPVLRQHAGIPVAEVLLVLMHACTLVMLWEWMEKGGRRNLMVAGAFAAFAAFAKNEGLALLPLIFLAALIFACIRRRRQLVLDAFLSILLATALIAPWLIYRHFLPHTHEDYGGRLSSFSTVVNDLRRLRQVLPVYLGHLMEFNTVGGIWLVLIVAALIGWRAFGRLPVVLFWFILLAHLAVYAATFMVTPWDLDILIPMVTSKLLLHIAPTAALLIGMHLWQFQADSRNKLSALSAA
jgi:hypothetical protein